MPDDFPGEEYDHCGDCGELWQDCVCEDDDAESCPECGEPYEYCICEED